jgi:hypothetical protein
MRSGNERGTLSAPKWSSSDGASRRCRSRSWRQKFNCPWIEDHDGHPGFSVPAIRLGTEGHPATSLTGLSSRRLGPLGSTSDSDPIRRRGQLRRGDLLISVNTPHGRDDLQSTIAPGPFGGEWSFASPSRGGRVKEAVNLSLAPRLASNSDVRSLPKGTSRPRLARRRAPTVTPSWICRAFPHKASAVPKVPQRCGAS